VQAAESKYKAAGNVAHLVYSGRKDAREALIIDIWTARTNIESFYADPNVKQGLTSLFDATGPNYGVYASTDWVTW
jgi:hypothetical protein